MTSLNRRRFVGHACSWAGASLLAAPSIAWADDPNLELAVFRADVSPPAGHPLCGGWIKPVAGQDDALEAIGLVLFGAGDPIVLCAVDWTGLLNSAHVAWRKALAEAAGTSPERVAVQCVHQHNAPFVCPAAYRLCAMQPDLPDAVMQPDFFAQALTRVADALRKSLSDRRRITHVASGQARVESVASNRRIIGPDGKIADWRGSSSKKPEHKTEPEGLIDPWLKTVAFYDGNDRVAACHYYATHPMSYYGDGRVSSDFAGLARKQIQQTDAGCAHLYFTGCAGNVAAGKYNDGTPEARRQLTTRMQVAMIASLAGLDPQPIRRVGWKTQEILPDPRPSLAADELAKQIANSKESRTTRIIAAMRLGWLRRCEARVPIVLSNLHIGQISLLHLPAEAFVEYQLRAQQFAGDRFVAIAGYGDGGPWYLPVRDAYPQGGYEVDVAFCAPSIDDVLSHGVESLLS